MSQPKPRRKSSWEGRTRRARGSLFLLAGLAGWAVTVASAAEPPSATEKPTDSRSDSQPSASAKPPSTEPSAERPVEFVALLRELRSAVHEVSTQRAAAQKGGDKVREICLYERQRALAQALESAETARVAWESANQAGDTSRAQTEQGRAQQALRLGRSLRSAAESCGGSVPVAAKPTTVTVAGPGQLDDPQPGPTELAKPNTLRLELPSRPNPASAFRQAR